MQLNILQIVSSYPMPPKGGIEVAVYNISRSLSRLGHNVIVAAPSTRARRTENEALFTTVDCFFTKPYISIPKLHGLHDLKRYIEWADVVHVHSPHEIFSQVSAVLAKAMKKKLVVSVLAHLSLLRHPGLVQRLLGTFLETSAQAIIKIADRVQVKNALDYALVTRINRRTHLVVDGVSKSVLSTPRHKTIPFQNVDLSKAFPVILYLGRIHPLKGPQEIIRMLPLVVRDYPDTQAVFAGFDDYGFAKELKSLASALGVKCNTVFLGAIDEKVKLDVIDAAHVVVIPSLYDHVEAFSITASEAWARGKPVVAYSVGALAYRVREGLNGYLSPPGDFKKLASKTIMALELRSVRSPGDVVSWTNVAEKLEAIYRDMRGRSYGVA